MLFPSHPRNLLAALVFTSVATTASFASAQVLGPANPSQPSSQGTNAQGVIALGSTFAPFNPGPVLAELQMRPSGSVVRKKHHMETDAVMADGRRVIVSFDLSGRLWEVEHADHDKYRFGDAAINSDTALNAARTAGFTSATVSEVKRNHTVISAVTRKNEPVELHVDRGGAIYKQVWVRR